MNDKAPLTIKDMDGKTYFLSPETYRIAHTDDIYPELFGYNAGTEVRLISDEDHPVPGYNYFNNCVTVCRTNAESVEHFGFPRINLKPVVDTKS